MKQTTHINPVTKFRRVKLYLQSPIHLHDSVPSYIQGQLYIYLTTSNIVHCSKFSCPLLHMYDM